MRDFNNWLEAMNEPELITKKEAIIFILKSLKSSMMMMSKPSRDKAFRLAEEHGITALDLLREFEEISFRV